MRDLFGEDLHTAHDIEGEQYAGTLVRETAAAILVDFGANNQQVWLPKSKIRYDDAPGNAGARLSGNLVIVTIPDWLAKEKGLIE